MKTALITGIAGQDGPYLAKLLLEKGYKVYGFMKPRTSISNLIYLGIDKHPKLSLLDGDLTDSHSAANAVLLSAPDEIYNLAAQSHVGYSFKVPQETCSVNYTGYLNVLLGARRFAPKAKIYQAGTSEMFGYAAKDQQRQNENTPLQPMSPYAISKVAAHWAGVNARHEANQFVSNGILFNHESPLREIGFVTRKIIHKITHNEMLVLGNIDSRRDWGHAADYVEAMWGMLQHDKPDDFVVSTGVTHSVRDFVKTAFKLDGRKIEFEGKGLDEIGVINGRVVMRISPEFYRPNDLTYLCGDNTKAKEVLRWKPKITFNQLVEDMLNGEYKRA